MSRNPSRIFLRTLILGTVAVLAACATTTPYQPLGKNGGFSEQRIETNRYRIAFMGNSSTPRQTVENYMLYRAAELTINSSFDYFILTGNDTEARTRYSESIWA